MDFAPYQSSPPEHTRVASPDGAGGSLSPRPSSDARRAFSPPAGAARSPPPLQHPQPQRGWSGFDGNDGGNAGAAWSGGAPGGMGGAGGAMPGAYPTAEISEFDTSLGIRLDYEACLAYLLCPPLGAIVLLILEKNSDYVRFHAWQSALLFTAIMVIHLIFSWSTFLSWLFVIGDLALIALLTMRAYRDAEILDRFEVPFFGRLASRFLDDE